MKRLIAIVCIDRIFAFELIYYYDINGKIIHEEKKVSKKKPAADSVCREFPVADFYEREIHEFFGIKFRNGSNEHLFLPENDEIKKPLLKKKVNKNA
ncbi:hypothetical protein COX58_02375 [archaeon CG_4_10_14_0_2_um_filter_Archaea_38_6]|nr:MAG: hypothetical protein COS83_00615 [archaeon CG07_land_8_20_14_0_80_38_8]PIU89198.1 MAG: hypothetical protein COS64_01255 [archaeon CG06_land_8_20_14_3_00_37_11]PIX44530.1 MAG: hypothetical protein COZ55_00305 [archaeon CG_4_8_14_3_um_filter_38_5]PJA22397.1 MAG: hypothetical protein COX58_02375 [archaeon CG_4_10_14_0_2_um_filter_Archaea_38_6]